jgi:hypothetical protein
MAIYQRQEIPVLCLPWAENGILVVPTGATRFRRKLSRPEGMPGVTYPQLGETTQLATHSWLSLPNQK